MTILYPLYDCLLPSGAKPTESADRGTTDGSGLRRQTALTRLHTVQGTGSAIPGG